MKIAFQLPTFFASKELFPNRIFAPAGLAIDVVNGLVGRGHEVVVFGPPGFETKGKHVYIDTSYWRDNIVYEKLRHDPPEDQRVRTDEVIKRNFELACSAACFAYAKDHAFDVIHSYHDFAFTPHYLEEMIKFPTVYTLHDPLPRNDCFEYREFGKFSHHRYVSISNSFRTGTDLKMNFVDTVYHGLDLSGFPFDPDPADYLLFMGRMVPEKGLHSAIKVALAVNMQLEIGSNLPRTDGENPYFDREIKPFIESPLIGEPGIVVGENKSLLTRKARALLFPIEWEEPFGMVLIEAMACGVPVIAYNRGSVPEIVKDGVTGFIVNENDSYHGAWTIKKTGIDGLVEAVNRLGEIDRSACRRHVEANFSTDQMVEGYERVYAKIVSP